ncbi:hypothetical protein CHUAL_014232 [Chamberlinius hualienensis]
MNRKMKIIFGLLMITFVAAQDPLSPIVSIPQGDLQGTIKFTPEGRQFYAFRGIPFGNPPVGDKRFKAPEPADSWTGLFSANADPPFCVQPTWDLTGFVGSEDCLQLSLYTPYLPTNSTVPSLPVHVHIHGGAYVVGNISYDNINPSRYLNYDMLVVALNYRLGPIGFLSTDDSAASGNFGLLDQNLGLKWVQNNIAFFGGNPDAVTLSGQSVGSVSAVYQMLSPMGAGLFHQVIAESGTPLIPWAVQENPRYYATAMGDIFNCDTSDTTTMIECLRLVAAEDIVAASFQLMKDNLTMVFVPNIETSASGQFITADPLTLLQTGNFNKVPLLLGFNRDEGCFVFDHIYFMFETINDTTFDVIIPNLLYSMTDFRTNLVNVSYAIKDKYYTGVNLNDQTAVNIATIKWMSDVFMKSGITETAKLVSAQNVNTYFYAYNYVSSHSTGNFTGEPDVDHSNELQYLWWRNITDAKDAEFGNRFFELWLDFIFNGEPTPTEMVDDPWLRTPAGQYNYYEINDNFNMRGNYDTDHMNFWWYDVPAIVFA